MIELPMGGRTRRYGAPLRLKYKRKDVLAKYGAPHGCTSATGTRDADAAPTFDDESAQLSNSITEIQCVK